MIYKTLDIIPYKLFIKISQNHDYTLLCTENEFLELNELNDIWDSIHSEYLSLNPSSDDKRILKIHAEIYHFQAKYNWVIIACRILSWDYDKETIDQLIEYGYSITHESFLGDLERIQKEAEGLLVKADAMAEELPKQDENDAKYSVDDMLASYSVFLGIDLDFNTIPATKVLSLGKQIDLKIKANHKQ